jgi:hypothetical protein
MKAFAHRGFLRGVVIGMSCLLAALLMLGAGAAFARRLRGDALAATQAGAAIAQAGGGGSPCQGAAGPLGLPEDRDKLFEPEENYVRSALPPGEEKYAKVDGAALKKIEEEIVAISEKSRTDGNQYWGRIAGTPYDRMTSDFMLDRFQKLGLEQVHRVENDLPPQWFPTSWEVDLVAGGKTIPLTTAFPLGNSVGTQGLLEAEPVWVGLGLPADFKGRDVKGKAVVVYTWPTPGGLNHTASWNGALNRALNSGAAMVLFVSGFPGNVTHFIFNGQTPGAAQMGPLTPVPAMTVGEKDGAAVRETIEHDENAKIRMRLDVKIESGLKTGTVWATLPGQSDETIIVMAHHDAYFDGALDNASGMAMMLEIARYYAAIPKAQRPRTMVFLDTPSHHSPGIVGSTWIRLNMKDFLSKVAFIVNCEHTAQTQIYFTGSGLTTSDTVGARRWYAGGSPAFQKVVTDNFREFGVALYSTPEAAPGGDLSQLYMTAPAFHIIDQIFYHTNLDTSDWTPASAMGTVARAYLKIIDTANKMSFDEIRGPNFHPTFPPAR